MENKFFWKKQLEKFEQAYLSKGTAQQYKIFLQKRGIRPSVAKDFIPREASELYTYSNNLQYHLNGRSILGVQRKWTLERQDDKYITRHGCSINTGLIQSDHSGFMQSGIGNMGETFMEAKDPKQLLDIAKRLLNLSNEEMAREFNIMSTQNDIATLFNAIILDPIIDYEIERNNFAGYSRCWNDSNSIIFSTVDNKYAYSIGLQDSGRDRYESSKTMIIELPNGESIAYKQNINNEKGENQYTIDDVSTEIIEIKGNSELIQRIVAQIERFSERKLEQQEDSIEHERNDEIQEIDSKNTHTSEDIELLTRQILTKKLQVVIDSFNNGISSTKPISIEEFELLTNMLYENVNIRDSIGNVSSDNTVTIPGSYTSIPAWQYSIIQLTEGKRICAEFLANKNSGTIQIKDFDRMTEPENESDFINIKKSIDEKELIDSFKAYSTDESLRQLLERKLHWQKQELASLEATAKTISETEALIDQQIEGQDRREK